MDREKIAEHLEKAAFLVREGQPLNTTANYVHEVEASMRNRHVTEIRLPLASDALAPRGPDGQVIGGGW